MFVKVLDCECTTVSKYDSKDRILYKSTFCIGKEVASSSIEAENRSFSES